MENINRLISGLNELEALQFSSVPDVKVYFLFFSQFPPSSKLETSRSVALGQKMTHMHVEFCQYAAHMSNYVDYRVCPEVSSTAGETDLCQQFSVSL